MASIIVAIKPSWYRAWAGDRRALPKSDGQGVTCAQTVLAPLQAQIAVFFGEPAGDLKALQAGVIKLAKGEPVICAVCKRNIFTEKHKADCELTRQYKDVTTLPPSPKR
jgi:hypothetical protein